MGVGLKSFRFKMGVPGPSSLVLFGFGAIWAALTGLHSLGVIPDDLAFDRRVLEQVVSRRTTTTTPSASFWTLWGWWPHLSLFLLGLLVIGSWLLSRCCRRGAADVRVAVTTSSHYHVGASARGHDFDAEAPRPRVIRRGAGIITEIGAGTAFPKLL